MFTIIMFIAGVFLGKNWDQVMSFVKTKLDQSKKTNGSAQRLDD